MLSTNNFGNSGVLFYVTIIFFAIILIGVMIALYWLFYQLLYGILLRKLNKNYKDLSKLEELN